MSNIKSRGEKWEIRGYAAIDGHFTFDLKPEKLVYCSVKVNGRFLIKSDARAMTDDQTTRNKPAKSQYKASKKPATNQQKRIEINTHTRVNFSLRRTFAGSNHA